MLRNIPRDHTRSLSNTSNLQVTARAGSINDLQVDHSLSLSSGVFKEEFPLASIVAVDIVDRKLSERVKLSFSCFDQDSLDSICISSIKLPSHIRQRTSLDWNVQDNVATSLNNDSFSESSIKVIFWTLKSLHRTNNARNFSIFRETSFIFSRNADHVGGITLDFKCSLAFIGFSNNDPIVSAFLKCFDDISGDFVSRVKVRLIPANSDGFSGSVSNLGVYNRSWWVDRVNSSDDLRKSRVLGESGQVFGADTEFILLALDESFDLESHVTANSLVTLEPMSRSVILLFDPVSAKLGTSIVLWSSKDEATSVCSNVANSWATRLERNSKLVLSNNRMRVESLSHSVFVDSLDSELILVSRKKLIGGPSKSLRAVSQWSPANASSLTLEYSISHQASSSVILGSSPSELNLGSGNL